MQPQHLTASAQLAAPGRLAVSLERSTPPQSLSTQLPPHLHASQPQQPFVSQLSLSISPYHLHYCASKLEPCQSHATEFGLPFLSRLKKVAPQLSHKPNHKWPGPCPSLSVIRPVTARSSPHQTTWTRRQHPHIQALCRSGTCSDSLNSLGCLHRRLRVLEIRG